VTTALQQNNFLRCCKPKHVDISTFAIAWFWSLFVTRKLDLLGAMHQTTLWLS
jgi:hypothetical protein